MAQSSKERGSFIGKVTTVVATTASHPDRTREVSFTDAKVIGVGTFGVVYQARLVDTDDMVAIKKVMQDRRFENRELQIMRELTHQNVVSLKYFFYSRSGEKESEVYLNLISEFIPETLYSVSRQYRKAKQSMPILQVKLYMYQLFRGLAYMHSYGICHRDIKPQNLLVNPELDVLKICDLGSAKRLVPGEPNVSYICSRYYRAPELIFGARNYSAKIDIWSAGCVLGELLLRQPIFPGESSIDQLVKIIRVLGTPTDEQIQQMNSTTTELKFPQIKPHPWAGVFRPRTPQDAIDLASELLQYSPAQRVSPLTACTHKFFDQLRDPLTRRANGQLLPPLFDFNSQELRIEPDLNAILIPAHLHVFTNGEPLG